MSPVHGRESPSWWGNTVPPTSVNLSATTWVGIGFSVAANTVLFGFRLYSNPQTDVGNHFAIIWDTGGPLWAARSFFSHRTDLAAVWQQCWLKQGIPLDSSKNYRMCVLAHTQYFRHNAQLVVPVTHNGITFIDSFQTTSIDPTLASITSNTNANGVDILVRG